MLWVHAPTVSGFQRIGGDLGGSAADPPQMLRSAPRERRVPHPGLCSEACSGADAGGMAGLADGETRTGVMQRVSIRAAAVEAPGSQGSMSTRSSELNHSAGDPFPSLWLVLAFYKILPSCWAKEVS